MYGDKKAFIWRDGELDWILNYSFHTGSLNGRIAWSCICRVMCYCATSRVTYEMVFIVIQILTCHINVS